MIQQRLEDDCTICCIAMALGLSYEAVMRKAEAARFGYKPGHGTISATCVLKDMGIEAMGLGKLSSGLSDVVPSLLWGRRAIIGLPSLNGWTGWHDCYWNGFELHDPSTKEKRYGVDALPGTPILNLVLFREGLFL